MNEKIPRLSRRGVPRRQKQAEADAIARLQCSDDAQSAIKRLIKQLKSNRESSLEQARDAVLALAESGDFDLMSKLIISRLPYEHARKEPAPPEPTAIVSDEPDPLSEEEFCARHGIER